MLGVACVIMHAVGLLRQVQRIPPGLHLTTQHLRRHVRLWYHIGRAGSGARQRGSRRDGLRRDKGDKVRVQGHASTCTPHTAHRTPHTAHRTSHIANRAAHSVSYTGQASSLFFSSTYEWRPGIVCRDVGQVVDSQIVTVDEPDVKEAVVAVSVRRAVVWEVRIHGRKEEVDGRVFDGRVRSPRVCVDLLYERGEEREGVSEGDVRMGAQNSANHISVPDRCSRCTYI